MTLHLIKLCVGVSEISEMAFWVDAVKAGRDTAEHITRAFPQRASEIIPGGSLYWVIKGMIACRQPILRFEKVQTNDGIEKCKIVFEPRIIVVRPAPRRPFQGWRYLEGADAPPDLASVTKVDAKMPEKMQRELAALGLL